ncbi:MAG: efflux RND transporter permease subunit, partial [Rikenellaceae bacterium]
DNLNTLFKLGNDIKESIETVDGIADLNVEQQIERSELRIVPRREMLARYGITLTEFSEFIKVALSGEVVSSVYEKDRLFDLTLKMDDDYRASIDNIKDLLITTGDGKQIPLSYVADVQSSVGPNTIGRENVKRKVVVSANSSGRDIKGIVDDIITNVNAKVNLPDGYFIEYGGQFESEKAASRTLMLVSIASIFIIFLILFTQFKSAKISALIMLNLPLAVIGGVISIWVTSGNLSIPAIIGFISLFGIATRNGILLFDHYESLEKSGQSLRDAIVNGSIDRLNPILMTALTSALALIPLAVYGNLPGNEIQSPMAVVILGGLISSTILNIFIMPIFYFLLRRHEIAKGGVVKEDNL